MQKVLVFQQKGSGESKVEGIRRHGRDCVRVKVFSIDDPLPPLLDDTDGILPEKIEADLVLDFLAHPDLSIDLAERCHQLGIPVIASGKKITIPGVFCPPT